MLNFSTKSPSTSMALRRRRTRLCRTCQYHAFSCLRSQVLTGRITSSSVWNFGLRPSGLQIGGNLGVLDRVCRKDGVKLSILIFCSLPESWNFCASLLCHAADRFLLDSCKAEIETLSVFFRRSHLRIEVDYLPSRPSIRKNSSFPVPEDSACLLSCWRRLFLNFFPLRWRTDTLTLCLLFKLMNPPLVCYNNPG